MKQKIWSPDYEIESLKKTISPKYDVTATFFENYNTLDWFCEVCGVSVFVPLLLISLFRFFLAKQTGSPRYALIFVTNSGFVVVFELYLFSGMN